MCRISTIWFCPMALIITIPVCRKTLHSLCLREYSRRRLLTLTATRSRSALEVGLTPWAGSSPVPRLQLGFPFSRVYLHLIYRTAHQGLPRLWCGMCPVWPALMPVCGHSSFVILNCYCPAGFDHVDPDL